MNRHKIRTPDPAMSDPHIEEVACLLNILLADEYVLYTKTRNAYWHTEGKNLHGLYRLFEKQVIALDGIIDDVAERTFSLSNTAPASMRDFLKITRLRESDDTISDSDQIIRQLLDKHETLIRILLMDIPALADAYLDPGTSHFMTAVLVKHEAFARRLKAHVFPS